MASTRLTRTFTTPTNNKIWTLSFWVKRGSLGASQWVINTDGGNQEDRMHFNPEDRLNYYEQDSGGGTLANFMPTAQLRDTNGWYHVVLSRDSTQATASDRLKMYYNGELQTVFTANTYPSQNSSNRLNTAVEHEIGARNSSSYFDGSMSHIHFIDGTAYDASAFGETDTTTGEWKINTSPSVTYGNNGFFILKNGNSVTDQSGNSNNFTVGGGTLTNTEDCPSNVFPTINPLTYSTAKWNLEYGNLRTNGLASGESAGYRSVYGTLGASSGKYYFEMKVTRTYSVDPNFIFVGIVDAEQMEYAGDNGNFVNKSRAYGYKGSDGSKENGGVNTSYGNSFTTNDIIGCAFDLDNHKIYWSKNGTWQNSGDPTSGATGTGSAFDLATGYTYLPAVCHFYDDDRIELNFGNGYFGTTAVSSAGTNASGNGIFEYDVPTGYTALSTKGLNL